MPILLELQIFHSPHATPTRRVAPGRVDGPDDALELMAWAIIFDFCTDASSDERARVTGLLRDPSLLHVPSTHLRFRIQRDSHGLDSSLHLVEFAPAGLAARIDTHGPPAAQVLGAMCAVAGRMGPARLRSLTSAVETPAPIKVVHYATERHFAIPDPRRVVSPYDSSRQGPSITARSGRPTEPLWPAHVVWALERLGISSPHDPREIRRAFRHCVARIHPDHNSPCTDAATEIAHLHRARDILLRWSNDDLRAHPRPAQTS